MISDIFEMLSWINICWELVKIIFYAETTAIEKLTELKVDRVTQTLIMQNTAALLSLYSQDRRVAGVIKSLLISALGSLETRF